MKSVKLYKILQKAAGDINHLAVLVRDDEDGVTEDQRKDGLVFAKQLVKDLSE